MDFDSRVPISQEDAMWQMNLGSEDETMVGDGSYPERPGEPDCSYYIRTGLCRFGSTCRFNHPHDRKLVTATSRIRGEYPERIGQPECEFYLKTGTCRFRVTCKFHHPRNKAGIAGSVSHNVLGYPLRPDEDDCFYFMRTGHCKFGGTCKLNHPQSQSINLMVSLRGSPVYSTLQSPTGQHSYSWLRASSISQGGLVSSRFHSGNSVPPGYYTLPKEDVFPERPGQPECEFYMKTGDCKFGTVCKFHHPRHRQTPASNCVLSPVGLPLRPGEPLCVFYMRYGICKFGPSCKFDHPMRVFTYNNNASPSSSSSSSSSSLHQETITTQLRNLLVSSSVEATPTTLPSVSEMTSAKDTIVVDVQH